MSAASHRDLLARMDLSEGHDGLWTSPDNEIGEVPEIGAILSQAGVVVGWIDVAWPHPGMPCRRLKNPVHVPALLLDDELDESLEKAITESLWRRSKALRRCRICRERHVPGHMDSTDVCQDCAATHLGVVY